LKRNWPFNIYPGEFICHKFYEECFTLAAGWATEWENG